VKTRQPIQGHILRALLIFLARQSTKAAYLPKKNRKNQSLPCQFNQKHWNCPMKNSEKSNINRTWIHIYHDVLQAGIERPVYYQAHRQSFKDIA
jgi:hypothetical protein